MRTLGLLGLVAVVLALTALASPWAWSAAAMMGRSFSFARVYDRVFEVLLVAGVLTAWRRLDLGSATGIGFRRHAWARELARGLAIGLAGLAVGLAAAALLGGLVPALRFPPGKTLRKALLGAGAAVAIGAGEEALFRGWLYPLFHETFGRRFWLSNGAQAALFGVLHPQAGRYAVLIGAWAFYEGWLTRRNGWSIRESVFHHFWYDVVIVTATLLTDKRGASVTVTFPRIRF